MTLAPQHPAWIIFLTIVATTLLIILLSPLAGKARLLDHPDPQGAYDVA